MSSDPEGQRIVATPQNGPVMMTRPQSQSTQLMNGQPVPTSSGGVLVCGQRPAEPGTIQQQIIRPEGAVCMVRINFDTFLDVVHPRDGGGSMYI